VSKGRLEAFSDAVIAIIMTVMVLGLRAPHGTDLAALRPLAPDFLSYVLSFVFLGIYWSNHHHLLQGAGKVTGGVLWANIHLLFWLSLTPFVTAWMGENSFASAPVALYGGVLFFSSVAYFILAHVLVRAEGPDSRVAAALGSDFKGKVSMLIYAVAVGVSFAAPLVSCGLYVLVALMWLVPDRRFERRG
jgi:uncharacterized membrane protein